MFSTFHVRLGALALLLAATGSGTSRAAEQVLRFSDPSSPGKVVIQLGAGDVRVTGVDAAEVKISSTGELADESRPRADGLRRLNSGTNYAITQDGNTITVMSGGMFGGHGHFGGAPNDITLQVPAGTAVKIERSGPGDTTLEGLSADVEIRAMSGDVSLVGLTGGAAVETMNGDVRAAFGSVPEGKAISISTAHGNVELSVPQETRATVRFRTLRGDMLTDFEENRLTTRSDVSRRSGSSATEGDVTVHTQVEVDRELVRDEARRAREQAREAQRAARAAAEEATRMAGGAHAVVPPMPPMPPMPSIPAISGGQVISGDLNGGGTPITITTLMGDITFRKAK